MQDLFSNLPVSLTVSDLNTVVNHEPRISHRKLAEILGFGRHNDIVRLVERNRAEIESFGIICQSDEKIPNSGKGRPSRTLWFNDGQALDIVVLSRAPTAAVVRKALIDVYRAYFYGKATPKQLPAPDTVQVRSYTRRKAISPAVKRYTEILEVALASFASMTAVCNTSLKEIDRMKYFKDAIVGVIKLAADMERAGAPREEVLRAAREGGSFVGYDCGGGHYHSGDVLDFPKHWAEVCPLTKDLIAKGLMAPRV